MSVAALPINAMDATALFTLLKKILDGLLEKGIRVVSCASDGTEVERSVQKLLLAELSSIRYSIKNPHLGCDPTVVDFGTYRGQVIRTIQDSKHALKTLRNNLFSGARLLTFGNFVSIFRHIADCSQGAGTPLFSRDVKKVDRQDGNAAVRLFSADVLKYLADHHHDYIGEIVYLFVFGELIDAYQNRSMAHLERIKLVLRARYFLNSWETYLQVCGYRKDRYFISREADDILHFLTNGLIALVIIHRDHLPIPVALLPWLHSSESCEHVFGEARRIVKDFTFLDFVYKVPKLRIKLHEAALRGKSSGGKARAAGYSHTYFDHEGLDLLILSTYPSDEEIELASEQAAREADSLVALLAPEMLHRAHQAPNTWLPSISSWMDGSGEDGVDVKPEDSGNEEVCDRDIEALHKILDDEESSPISRSEKIDQRCLDLTSAALAIASEDATIVYVKKKNSLDNHTVTMSHRDFC